MKRCVVFAMTVCLLPYSFVLGDDIKAELTKAFGKCVAGDIRPIFSVFDSIEDVDQSEYAVLHDRYQKRFITADEHIEFDDPFITDLYACYRAYWRSSLLDPDSEKASRKILLSELDELSQEQGREPGFFEGLTGPNVKKLELFLIIAASGKGYHVTMGRTPPLRELLIWTKEEKEIYEVKLPSESFSVDVVFAQEFLSHGWLGYATFNRNHTGGWCFGGPIYRVGSKPGENNEHFRVSVLGHEGRHKSDQKRYGVTGWVLEYRAKLTELLLAEKTFWDLLTQFRNEAQDLPSIPHVYASYRLLNDVVREVSGEQEPEAFHTVCFEDYSMEDLKIVIELVLDRSTKSLEADGR